MATGLLTSVRTVLSKLKMVFLLISQLTGILYRLKTSRKPKLFSKVQLYPKNKERQNTKGKETFSYIKNLPKDNKWLPGLLVSQAFDTSTQESLSLPC